MLTEVTASTLAEVHAESDDGRINRWPPILYHRHSHQATVTSTLSVPVLVAGHRIFDWSTCRGEHLAEQTENGFQ